MFVYESSEIRVEDVLLDLVVSCPVPRADDRHQHEEQTTTRADTRAGLVRGFCLERGE